MEARSFSGSPVVSLVTNFGQEVLVRNFGQEFWSGILNGQNGSGRQVGQTGKVDHGMVSLVVKVFTGWQSLVRQTG